MHLSELQKKDIINVFDGCKIGKIIDICFNKEGYIESIVVERNAFIKGLFTSDNIINISFNQIKKLGEDVIMVELT